MGPARSRRRRVGPHVAHLGRGHGDHLAHVGRVGEDLLVAAHRGVEDDLAHRLAGGARTPRPRTVVPSARARMARFVIVSPREADAVRPPTTVRTTRPVTLRPWKGVFRLLDWNVAASTVHSAPGSRTSRRPARRARGVRREARRSRAGPEVRSSTSADRTEHPRPHQLQGRGSAVSSPMTAVGGLGVTGTCLSECAVGRVVGGDGVDGAVGEALADGGRRRSGCRSGGFILAWVS